MAQGKITATSARLHRDRRAVIRHVDELEKTGLELVYVEPEILPGHDRMKEVRAPAEHSGEEVSSIVYGEPG